MGGTRFMVQWEEHPSHLATRLGQLLEHQTLVDVTLMCNTHTLRVHRAVLAACSPYFETILQRQLGLHPLIVLKDMQFSVLKSLIEFMYCGETSVTEDNLGALLQAAKFFQVKGLSAMTREALGLPSSPQKTTTTAVNGEAARKAFMGRSKRVGIQQTLVPASGLKSSVAVGGDGTKTTFQVASKTVPMSSQQQTHQQAESAQLLLSLSGGDFVKQQTPSPTLQTVSKNVRFHQPRTVSTVDARKESSRAAEVIERVPVMTTGAGISKPVVDKQEVKTVYMPEAPRRRGRPLKRSMNLVFKEKVISETELALQKEAEASRKALEALQEEMKSGDGQQQLQQQQQQQTITNKTVGMVTARPAKMHVEPVSKPPATELVPKQEPLYQVSNTSGENVIYQLADGSDGASGNIMYKVGDQLIAAQGASNDGNIVYQLAEGIKSGDIVYQVADNNDETQVENNNTSIIYQVAEGENVAAENTVSNQCMEVLKEAGLPTNVPILLDSGDGQYITVNEEVLMNIVNGGMVQVADGNIVGGEGLQFIVQELPEEPGAPSEDARVDSEPVTAAVGSEPVTTAVGSEPVTTAVDSEPVTTADVKPVITADVMKQNLNQIPEGHSPVASQDSLETLEEQPFESVIEMKTRQDSLDTPVIENTLNTLAELTLTASNRQVQTTLHNPVIGLKTEASHSEGIHPDNAAVPVEAESMHPDSAVVTSAIGDSSGGVQLTSCGMGEENEIVPQNKPADGTLVTIKNEGNGNVHICGDEETDEVITGDSYGEEARSGFSVLRNTVSPSKDEFSSQFLQQDNSVTKYTDTTTACEEIGQNFIFQEESSGIEAPEKVAVMEQGKRGGTMSVEQELEAMMGETSDVDDTSKEKEEEDSRETMQQGQVANAQPGSTTDEETQDLRMVLSPEEPHDMQSADDSLDDSILMVLSPDGSGNIKLNANKSAESDSLVGREDVKSTSDVKSILPSDVDTSTQVPAQEGSTAGEFVILNDGMISNVEGDRQVDDSQVENSQSSEAQQQLPEESAEFRVVDNTVVAHAVVSGVEMLEDVTIKPGENAQNEANPSPPKDIPYAVGLLPLKTALEKLQAMPEHHPRKTRSGSKDSPPECRAKRKASLCNEPEKRLRLSEEDEDDDLEVEEVHGDAAPDCMNSAMESSTGVAPLPSMVELTPDANDG